jgi:hypothetical protein
MPKTYRLQSWCMLFIIDTFMTKTCMTYKVPKEQVTYSGHKTQLLLWPVILIYLILY